MLHPGRRFSVSPVATSEELAQHLTGRTWKKCTGFQHAGHFFLNDSAGSGPAQEYVVVKRILGEHFTQLETVLFNWMEPERALETIQQIVRGECESLIAENLKLYVEWPEMHGGCVHCS